MEGETAETPTLFPATVGEKLRAAREAQGIELAELAARTRIPQRHLEAIERGNYSGLPSVTYSLGFAKSYARAVGADEVEIARDLRLELGHHPERAAPTPSYEMSDPARVPPRGLAWAGLAIGLLVLVGVVLWYGTDLFRGSVPPPETLTPTEGTSAGAPGDTTPANDTASIASGGQVTLIALETVWIRVNDGNGQRLFEKEMTPGERYDVPMTADRPRVRTGGPEKIRVTVNGSNVAPLGPGGQTVDVDVSAAALQARGQAPAATPETAAPRPQARAPIRPAASRLPAPVPGEAPAEPGPVNAAAP
jgi:cytoskeleton protein RodZ